MTRYNEPTGLTKKDLIELALGFEIIADQLRRHAAMLEQFGREELIATNVASADTGMKKIKAFMKGIAEGVVDEVGRPLDKLVAAHRAQQEKKKAQPTPRAKKRSSQ